MIAEKRYIIVSAFLYETAIKAIANKEYGFSMVEGKPYFLGAEIIQYEPYDC